MIRLRGAEEPCLPVCRCQADFCFGDTRITFKHRVEFIEQYKWSGLSSTVPSCVFLCVLLMYIFILCFMARPSSVKSRIVLCYNINKLTYLLRINSC